MPASPSDQKKRLSRSTNGVFGGRRRASAASVRGGSSGTTGTAGPSAPASPAGVMPNRRRGPGAIATPLADGSPRQAPEGAVSAPAGAAASAASPAASAAKEARRLPLG